MKVAKARVWKTVDGKLVEDGHKDAAFLFAPKGGQVPDKIVAQFDNGDEFFEDAKLTHSEVSSHPVAPMSFPGQTNVGTKQPPADQPSNIPVSGPDPNPGYTNVGKKGQKVKGSSSVTKVDDPTPIPDSGK